MTKCHTQLLTTGDGICPHNCRLAQRERLIGMIVRWFGQGRARRRWPRCWSRPAAWPIPRNHAPPISTTSSMASLEIS